MKNKEEILKEFSEIFDNLKISNIQATGLLLLISKAIAKTREETIMEVDKLINNEYIIKDIYKNSDDLLNDIKKELNKLKK